MSVQLRPQHQAVLLGLAQGWDTIQIARALGRSRSAIYLWANESRAIVEASIPEGREDLALQTKTMAGLVMVARTIGFVDPDLRLLPGGIIAMTPAAAARGRQI